jgi:hypothetical protein
MKWTDDLELDIDGCKIVVKGKNVTNAYFNRDAAIN